MMNFTPGKIIVKFKDHVDTRISYTAKGVGFTNENIGKLLGIEDKVSGSTVLFSQQSVQQSMTNRQVQRTDSRLPEIHSLKNIFTLSLKDKQENVLALVEDLKKNPDVEYAEPDYVFSINDFKADSKTYTDADFRKSTGTPVTPSDPLYAQQSNITATHINEVWNTYGTGNGSQVIAILDTGVDYNHPDLAPNIWTNAAELNGIEGFDDDGNGFIDDIRGWDFINNDNAPLDDNMHGTHVAGIAGAVGGNGIGIAGAAWNVQLMPIKVFQSNGQGNASDIALGIQYASNKGATIINMSFGSFSESITMRNALENAYATAVLVAAAGNNGTCIGPGLCPDNKPGAPFYPGAYSFVLGVQDIANYSNYDQDGSVFSGYPNLLNYELSAPGSGIMSTVPNGGYKTLTGTSMATPLVAGGIALYLQQKPTDSKELMFGNLINSSTSFVDFKAAIEITPKPQLEILSAINKDNSNNQNGNGFLEPNEIIDILPLVKNYWGPTNDVRVGIEFSQFEDQTKATILTPEITIGSINAYATLQDLTKSLKIKIAPNVANNVNIKFVLKVWSGPNKDYLTTTDYLINIKNSIILSGLICEDLTLYPEKEYLVSNNLVICPTATLTIMPGVNLKFSDNKSISVEGNLVAIGTSDKLITFSAEDNSWSGIKIYKNPIFKFCKFTDVQGGATYIFTNKDGSFLDIENCIFSNNAAAIMESGKANKHQVSKSVFVDNYYFFFASYCYDYNYKFSNIIRNNSFMFYNPLYDGNNDFQNNNIFSNGGNSFKIGSNTNINFNQPNYLGSSKSSVVSKNIQDFFEDSSLGVCYLNKVSTEPSQENHGIVWKVLVNGKDAQDEYEQMDPIGVGEHEFKVYFNRAMDTNRPPQISYGVREPYNQKIISEQGTWSADGKIYTVNHDVKIGAADGINRIRVEGARDLDNFDIPIEDYRFNMLVQSAGSASVGFEATPGLGKIALEWEAPDDIVLEDVLGYNMYRYTANADQTFTDPVKINSTLIANPAFTDFNVEEGKTYYYKYKILRTSFEETDYSKTVAVSPLTSKLGDSNGDFDVNVMDLVQSVDYILGNNPTPFIFLAADVNNDKNINVLDIVGTVDLILEQQTGKKATPPNASGSDIVFYPKEAVGDATFYWEGNDLYVESNHAIGGLQLAFDSEFEFTKSAAINGFESLSYKQDNQKVVMIYSFNGTAIPAGKTKLLTKSDAVSDMLDISKAVVGTPNGLKLNASYNTLAVPDIVAPLQTNFTEIKTLSPNPTSGLVNIEYYLPENMDSVSFSVYDLLGKRIWNQNNFKNTSGYSNVSLDLNGLNSNVYIMAMDAERNGELKDRIVKKIIVKK